MAFARVSPATYTDKTEASFEWEATGPVSTFQCQLDAEEPAPCAGGLSVSSLVEGPHEFSVWATEENTPVSDPARHNWTVDTTVPVVVISTVTSDYIASTSMTFEFATQDLDLAKLLCVAY